MKKVLLFLLVVFGIQITTSAQDNFQKPRIIVLTDIENEPDDAQSLVRFLTYSNQFDIEGLIATTSVWLPEKTAEWRIHEIIEAYGKVEKNLLVHAEGFPSPEYLKSITTSGIPEYGMDGVGENKDSQGSQLIISSLKNEDERPLWILAWGGPNCLAQAIWKMQQTESPEDFTRYISKLRVYTISDQDDSGPWIRNRFPEIFYICSPGYAHDGIEGYHFATWSGISGDTFHGRFQGANKTVISNAWIKKNIQSGHGALGEQYPDVEYLMEGDSPSFLYLVNNGLGDSEHPNYGSWGGRYEYYTPRTEKYFFEPETRPFWTNAVDEVWSHNTNSNHTGNHETIWRWREHFQNDFAARMDWCVKSYEEANHPPIVALNHAKVLTVQPGETVRLDASTSSDSDGDTLSYKWIYYREVGNSVYWLKFNNTDSAVSNFIAPDLDYPQQMHFVVEVTDNGTPSLTRYGRVIVNVNKKVEKPRIIVTTDGEIDDKSSFIRFLMYSNEFETKGLIYGNSKWQPRGHGIDWMQESIDKWSTVRNNLLLHMDGYPTPEELKSVVSVGNMDEKYLHHTGPLETEGARHILRVLMDKDIRPVWVQAWGGTNTIAQALAILRRDYRQEDIEYALGKLRIFAISDQDNTSEWIRNEFPEVFFLLSHQFTALNYQHEGHPYSNHPIFDDEWITKFVKENHGLLGESYPQKYFSEGDSPAFLHLINNGLRTVGHPSYGGWGGRYTVKFNEKHFSDALDNGDHMHGQWIWLLDIQNDFAARMDWSVKSFDAANHHPILDNNIPEKLLVSSGQSVTLDAGSCSDPDRNELSYKWWHYHFAGEEPYRSKIHINNDTKKTTAIDIPEDAGGKQLHIILEVSDNGKPMLKRYHRIILEVQ